MKMVLVLLACSLDTSIGHFKTQDSRLKTQVSRLDLWEMKKLISSEVPSDC